MIDIHCHIVYGVDDGSKNIEQSIRMIKQAISTGFTKICLTPHYMEDGYRSSRSVLEEKLKNIKEELKKEKIDIDLMLGEEIFIFPNLAKKLDDVVTLNDSKYILIEFPLIEDIQYIDEVIYELQTRGKTVILAHPERYYKAFKDFSFIENLVDKGVLLQVNINSIVGHYGKDAQKLAYKLLREDLVTFLASDSHSSAGYLKAKESLEVIKKLIGEEKLIKLTETNPSIVINNKDFAEEDLVKVRKSKKIENVFIHFLKSVPIIQRML